MHPYFVPPVYDLLQPEGFFKMEEEQISSINIRIRELENSRSYLDSKEKWKTETEQAKAMLNQAKAALKAAKDSGIFTASGWRNCKRSGAGRNCGMGEED